MSLLRMILMASGNQGDPTILGRPIITRKNDEIIGWKTTCPINLDGNTNVDTGFIPFTGNDFVLRLIAELPSSGNVNKSTILNAMDESGASYNGFCIRKSSALQTKLYYGNNNVVISDDDDIDITITKVGTVLTAEHKNGTTVINADYNIGNLTIVLGSSVQTPGGNDYFRYANGIIKYFSISKIE